MRTMRISTALALVTAAALITAGCSAAPPVKSEPARPRPAAAPAAALPEPVIGEGAPANEQGDAELAAAPGLKSSLDRYARGEFDAAAASLYAVVDAPSSHSKSEIAVLGRLGPSFVRCSQGTRTARKRTLFSITVAYASSA
jgi:hypothetical protein